MSIPPIDRVPARIDIVQELSAQKSGFPEFLPWDQVNGQFGVEPCKFTIEDFDLGVMKTLGAFIDPNSPVDTPSFVIPVKGLKPEHQRQLILDEVVIPVTFGHPEAYMNIWELPGIFIRREGIEPDLQRYSQELEAFRGPAPNTKTTAIPGELTDVTMVKLTGRRFDTMGNVAITKSAGAPFDVSGMSGGSSSTLPTGAIEVLPATELTDGQTFTLNDGVNPPKTFEFDKNGSVTPGNVAIAITNSDSQRDVALKIIDAINGVSDFDIAANSIVGPNELFQRIRAEAYNLRYIIDMIARYRTDANALLRTVLPRFKQHKAIIVRGSSGQLSEFTAFLEGVDDIQEVLGVTMKHVGFSLSINVIAELDLNDNTVRQTARTIDFAVAIKKGNIGIVPETGEIIQLDVVKKTPDGLPLKTKPANSLGRICSMAPNMK